MEKEAGSPLDGSFMSGAGAAARLMRETDWSKTAAGPVAAWPAALKTVVGMLLHSRHPMFLWWGPELVQFYNDAYLPSFGLGKHPAAMGQRGADCWQEIWPVIWPQIDDVMRAGKASWNEDQLVPIFRNGRIEDVYWTYGYSPVFGDDGRIGGTLVVCSETTRRVVAERRQRTARVFADTLGAAAPTDDVAAMAVGALAQARIDVPLALFYRQPAAGASPPQLRGAAADANARADADRSLQVALQREPETLAEILAGRCVTLHGAIALPGPRGPEPVTDVFLVPSHGAGRTLARDFVAFGLNPRVPFDDDYREFLVQLTQSISLARARVDAARIRRLALRERNNLLMQAPVATAVLVGPELVFELANDLFCRLVGRTDLVGKRYVEAFPELVGTDLPAILAEVYRSGVRHVSPERPIRLDRAGRGELEDRYFEFNLEPMRDVDDSVYGLMAVAVDVTAQVEARRALERSNAERERLLEQAESASRAKDEFLAMLGHELRNPLSPIVTALQVMRLREDSTTQKEQATIRRQVDHLVRLVDDLLDVSKIIRGKVQLKRAPADLAEIVARAVEMAGALIDERQHALTVDVPEQPVVWHGDAARLAQVIANLLTNAARYTAPNGRIALTAARAGDEIVIRVADNGIGIAPELLPHLFETFFQGQRSADRAEGGLGLGLALVKNLVALHGGTARAFSAGPGRGSEFVVTLPVRGARGDDDAVQPAAPAGVERPRRVLIVDDNRDAAESLAEMLRLDGHTVRVAFQPLAGLALAEEFGPDVAVLDIGLPSMDGYELARRFRQRFGSDCRLIALTGYGQADDRERSSAAGFAAHLVKPVDLEQLSAVLAG
jgi:signal transduction histidine kinase/CheY-like chemotaxis protein